MDEDTKEFAEFFGLTESEAESFFLAAELGSPSNNKNVTLPDDDLMDKSTDGEEGKEMSTNSD